MLFQHEDSVSWTLTANKSYSEQSARSNLRSSGPMVDWYKVVWFKYHVPRWSFIHWMIILGRLSTRDRLCQRGVASDPSCPVCCSGLKSHEHLFFDFPFSTWIWSSFMAKNGVQRQRLGLTDEVRWTSLHRGGTTLQHLMFKLSLASCMYNIWRERNTRIFQGLALLRISWWPELGMTWELWLDLGGLSEG